MATQAYAVLKDHTGAYFATPAMAGNHGVPDPAQPVVVDGEIIERKRRAPVFELGDEAPPELQALVGARLVYDVRWYGEAAGQPIADYLGTGHHETEAG